MKNKSEIIDRRIRSLFGEIGNNKGQLYLNGKEWDGELTIIGE